MPELPYWIALVCTGVPNKELSGCTYYKMQSYCIYYLHKVFVIFPSSMKLCHYNTNVLYTP